ncbi:hypothetical protein [Lyngbya confervoides]|uniref:Cardiolipin synthase N-terminal domain-containing protein n=1 Tax=Lyngbya confervoides BDU141951 TaxID=1574623 RepID=A0ABD4T009_9CYAN|nr:hypothetical protein [Lyngbya confervoides]MCM1981907.1 hypothetical protein [Lyngbya confervoides BDU141951]
MGFKLTVRKRWIGLLLLFLTPLIMGAARKGVGVVIGLLFYLLLLGAFIGSLVWAYRDATRRGKPGFWVALMVAILWPLGILLWIVFRPPLQGDRVHPHS